MNFPETWPQGCPSNDTPPAEVEIFRIVRHDPVLPTDFQSHLETGRLPQADPCLRCGLSVFRLIEDAWNQQKLLPNLGKRIARANLNPEHGKACLTKGQQPTHTTWWPYRDVNRAELFTVVKGVS